MNAQLHDHMIKVLDKYTPVYLCEGNFTVCLLVLDVKSIGSVPFGITKRNPNCDEFLPERGREIALARATKKLMEKKVNGKRRK